MPCSHSKIGTIDVAALKERLQDNSLYGEFNFRRDAYGSPHSKMTDIWVRYNDIKNFGPHFNDEHDSVWYPVSKRIPEIFPVVFGVMSAVRGERLGGVLITKLPPGGSIARHTDSGWHARYYDKYYVGIKTGGVFGFEDGDIRSNEGDIYWFDNSIPHWVTNDSDDDRISLIICLKRFNE